MEPKSKWLSRSVNISETQDKKTKNTIFTNNICKQLLVSYLHKVYDPTIYLLKFQLSFTIKVENLTKLYKPHLASNTCMNP